MADYYPSMAQVVNGLKVNTAATRRSIYDRARIAVAGQLRDLAAALSDADINRELLALERAIRKVEQENLFPLPLPTEASPVRPDPRPHVPVEERDDRQTRVRQDDRQVQLRQSEPISRKYRRPQPPSFANTVGVTARKPGPKRKLAVLAITGVFVAGMGGLGLLLGSYFDGPLPSAPFAKIATKLADRVAAP